VLLCFFAFAAVALARSWPQARPALAHLSVASIGLATVVALVSRLPLSPGDLGWGLVALLAERRRRPAGGGPVAIGQGPDRVGRED
jgi:hypothetical protein